MAKLPRTTKRPARSTLAGVVDDAILYGRVSTDDQEQARTIDAQKDFLRGYAQLYKLNVVGEFWDDGVSGTIPLGDRPAGARLLEAAASHRGAVVVVYKLDRLGRSLRVVLDGHDALKTMGVSLRSGTEPFDSSTAFGTFMLQFLAGMAELDRANLLERMALGRDRVAKDGKWTGGPIPYGYDVDGDGRLVPSLRPAFPGTESGSAAHEATITEAEVARAVFRRVADGAAAKAEAARLNAEGIPSPTRWAPTKPRPGKAATAERVRPWLANRVVYMLHNPAYYGEATLQSEIAGEIARPVATPLVDHATWERVQTQLTRNRIEATRNTRRFYLLSGMIRCACGCGYVGAGGANNRRTYRCDGRRRGLPCDGLSVPADVLEQTVWDDCRAWALNPGEALADAQRALRERLAAAPALDEERRRLGRALGEKQAERARVLEMARRGMIPLDDAERDVAAVVAAAAAIQSRIDGLAVQQDIAAAFEARHADASVMLARIRERLPAIEAGLTSHDPATRAAAQVAQRGVVGDLVPAITLRTERDGAHPRAIAEITYCFGDPRVTETEWPSPFALVNTPTLTLERALSREAVLAGASSGA